MSGCALNSSRAVMLLTIWACDIEADAFQGLDTLLGQHIPTVLHGADEVVQEQRFVVAFHDVLSHQPLLYPEASFGEISFCYIFRFFIFPLIFLEDHQVLYFLTNYKLYLLRLKMINRGSVLIENIELL